MATRVSAPLSKSTAKAGSALFYGVVSCSLMLLNKQIFALNYPSSKVLALSQMLVTCIVLSVLRLLGKVDFPPLSVASLKAVFPLPLFFLLNLVAGLGGTAALSLPMFTSLRRFSIWFTLAGEYYIFGTQHSFPIKFAVGTMVFGSLVAALDDLAFDAHGYAYATVNNFATAGNGIATKVKLNAKDLGVAGLLFYNSFVSMLILLIYVGLFEQDKVLACAAYPGLSSPPFIAMFLCSSLMGLLINLSAALCTMYNSALTATAIGCLKNVLTTYVGMVAFSDYTYSAINFAGVNVSLAGSIYYAYVKFLAKQPQPTLSQSGGEVENASSEV
jgi:solute carrier family 35 protein